MEQFSNDYESVLNANIDADDLLIQVASATGSPAVNFRIKIDDELMLVTNKGAGTDWTVTRSIEGTTPAAHLLNAPVVHVLTAGALAQMVSEVTSYIADPFILPGRLTIVNDADTVTGLQVGKSLNSGHAPGTFPSGVSTVNAFTAVADGHADGTTNLRNFDARAMITGANNASGVIGYSTVARANMDVGATVVSLTGITASGSNIGAGNVTSNAAAFAGSTSLTGTGNIVSAYIFLANSHSRSGAGLYTTTTGLHVSNQGISGGTNSYGINVNAQSGSTTSYGIRSSTVLSGIARWNIFVDGTAPNAFTGSTRFGSIVAPTVTLDVTGSALISADLTVSGDTTIGTVLGDVLTINAGAWTYGTNWVSTRAAGVLATGTIYLSSEISTFTGDAGGSTSGTAKRFLVTASGTTAFANITGSSNVLTYSADGLVGTARVWHSTMTLSGAGSATNARMNDSNFTLTNTGSISTAAHFNVSAPTFTNTGDITTLYGYRCMNIGHATLVGVAAAFKADDITASVTSARGFQSSLATGTGKFNLYIDGTAHNYFLSDVSMGSTAGSLDSRLFIAKSHTGTSGTIVALRTNATATAGSASTAEYIGNFCFAGSDTATNYAGASFTGMDCSARLDSANTWTAAYGIRISPQANHASAIITTTTGVQIKASTAHLGSYTTIMGIDVLDQKLATLTIAYRGRVTSGTGKWNLYLDGTAVNGMTGFLRIGSVVAPTVALDVTGAAIISTNLTVNDNTILGSGAGDTLTVNADTWTLGTNPTITRAAGAVAAGTVRLVFNTATFSGDSGGTSQVRAYRYLATGSGGFALNTMAFELSAASTVSVAHGTLNTAFANTSHAGTGALTNMHGVSSTLSSSNTGNTTVGIDYEVAVPSFTSTGTIVSHYGFHVSNLGNALTSTAIGLFVSDFSASTNMRGIQCSLTSGSGKHNLYIDGTAVNYLLGCTGIGIAASSTTALVLAASVAGVSSLRVPHGTVPSAPVNGDIWTTTAGLYVQINGTTVGPLT